MHLVINELSNSAHEITICNNTKVDYFVMRILNLIHHLRKLESHYRRKNEVILPFFKDKGLFEELINIYES